MKEALSLTVATSCVLYSVLELVPGLHRGCALNSLTGKVRVDRNVVLINDRKLADDDRRTLRATLSIRVAFVPIIW